MKPNNRWYDAHTKLAEALESLKGVDRDARGRIVAHVVELINERAPGLLEKYLLDFPLDRERRRWYDKDPYLWLMVNGLRFAKPELLGKATKYMAEALRQAGPPARSAPRGRRLEGVKKKAMSVER